MTNLRMRPTRIFTLLLLGPRLAPSFVSGRHPGARQKRSDGGTSFTGGLATTPHGRLIIPGDHRFDGDQAGCRIPTVAIGTPFEDAHRRDLTMNALFYNVSTKQVEDWTGKGLCDLASRLCRTPLAAAETFLDDPLRLCRAVRFAVRFSAALDGGIMAGARYVRVRAAMARKVSRGPDCLEGGARGVTHMVTAISCYSLKEDARRTLMGTVIS